MTEINNLERINSITLWKSEYLLGHQEQAERERLVTRMEMATTMLVTKLETKCVDDSFEIFVTVLTVFVTNTKNLS